MLYFGFKSPALDASMLVSPPSFSTCFLTRLAWSCFPWLCSFTKNIQKFFTLLTPPFPQNQAFDFPEHVVLKRECEMGLQAVCFV